MDTNYLPRNCSFLPHFVVGILISSIVHRVPHLLKSFLVTMARKLIRVPDRHSHLNRH